MSEDNKKKDVYVATSESVDMKKNNDSCTLSSVSQENDNLPCLSSDVPPVGEPPIQRKRRKTVKRKTLEEIIESINKRLTTIQPVDPPPKDPNDESCLPTTEKVPIDSPNDETEPKRRHGQPSKHDVAIPTRAPSSSELIVAQSGEARHKTLPEFHPSSSLLLPQTQSMPPQPPPPNDPLPSAIPDSPEFQLQDYAEAIYGKEVFSRGEPPVVGVNTALMVYVQNPHYHNACNLLTNAARLPPPLAAADTMTTNTATHNDAGPMDSEPKPNIKAERRSTRKTRRPTKLDEFV